jgi:indolepyruvate ferredoxin oxidoreductase
VPLAEGSLLRAIELNDVAVEFNGKAFLWGRRAAANLAQVERLAMPAEVIPISQAFSRNLDELIARRVEFLTAYQNAAYAHRYRALVERVRAAESKLGTGTALTEAVARYYFKLMAYKDEYEVARLYADPAFARKIEGMFEGGYRLRFHLAPPIFNRPDPRTGEARKSEFGAWMMPAFKLLAKLKGLRGTALDVFGHTEERKTERRLIDEYETTVAELLERLDRDNHKLAVEIASTPEHIRGFGHVKRRHLGEAKKKEAELLVAFRAARPAARAA